MNAEDVITQFLSDRQPPASGNQLSPRDGRADHPNVASQVSHQAIIASQLPQSNWASIDCTVGIIRFRNNGRIAFAISAGGFDSAIGNDIPGLEKGSHLHLEGWPSEYGGLPQLKYSRLSIIPPKFHDAAALALTRRKVSPADAAKLIKEFGPDCIEKIVRNPELLNTTAGLGFSPKKRKAILTVCMLEGDLGLLKKALLEVGFANDRIDKIIGSGFSPTKNTPWVLVSADLASFREADKFAQTPFMQNIAPFVAHGVDRAMGVVAQCLNDSHRNGHCGLHIDVIADTAALQFNFPREKVLKAVRRLVERHAYATMEGRDDHIWRPRSLANEQDIASIVLSSVDLASSNPGLLVKRIKRAARRVGLDLNPEQQAAVENALTRRLSIVTGGPGTGKTAAVCRIIGELMGGAVIGTALASRAAFNLQELAGVEAMNSHRLLGLGGGKPPSIANLIGRKALIVDEASMLSVTQVRQLLSAARQAKVARVIMVGDGDQLAPVGEGEPFHDLLQSGKVPTTRLTQIYRFKNGGGIATLCNDVRQGAAPLGRDYGEDVRFFETLSPEHTAAEVIAGYRKLIAAGVDYDDIAVLALFNDREHAGIAQLNDGIRKALGRDDPGAGELIMVTKNDNENEIYNGERGVITEVSATEIVFRVGDRQVVYPRRARPRPGSRSDVPTGPAENIAWGYASTVHKFQGGERPHVIFALSPGVGFLFGKPALYTGFSRAKQSLTVVGALDEIPKTLARGPRRRTTALPFLLGVDDRDNLTEDRRYATLSEPVNWASVGAASEQPLK